MEQKRLILIIVIATALSSCVKICAIGPIKSTAANVTFGQSKIPCYKQNDFKKAVDLAIQAIYSSEFELRLEDHIKNKIGTGAHVAAWDGVKTNEVVEKMRKEVSGKYVETYGGIGGLWLYLIYGNLAYDGTETGPIRINRAPLRKRSAESISGTISHEVAHRIGLTHPHSNSDLEIAYKEPAYVVGDILYDIAKESLAKARAN